MTYAVDADIYEGPLPLLVELTKHGLLNVFLIKLVDLTHSYLVEVKNSQADANALAEPLPLLGTLMVIKARELLPQPAARDCDEEVPVSLEELQRRLQEYQQFKSVAQLLCELHALSHQHFGRSPMGQDVPEGDSPSGASGISVSLGALMNAFSKVLGRSAAAVYEVKAEPWTVEDKVQELRVLLTVRRHIRFLELFEPNQHRLELVVTFLALLELIRQRFVRAIQERSFEDILILHQET